MRNAPTFPAGTTLCFDRAGQRLVVAEADAITVVDLANGKTSRLPYPAGRAVAAFDDQLWIALPDDRLIRISYEGRALGEPIALPFAGTPGLIPAPCGPAAAVWPSSPPVALIDDFGALTRSELTDSDAALPLTGRRCIAIRGTRVTLPSGMAVRLAPGTLVLGGAVMSDGKASTLLATSDSGPQLVVISLSTAQIVQRCAMPSARVWLATKGYVAIAKTGTSALSATDLRTGRELGATVRDAVRDLAIDPAGRRLALQLGDGSIELHELADFLRRAPEPDAQAGAPRARDDANVTAVRASGPTTTGEPAADRTEAAPPPYAAPAVPPAPAPLRCPPLIALAPRTRPAPLDPVGAHAQLDRELRSVSLWTLGAIANAWDTRRLGYGNEGRHPYELEVAAILGMGGGLAPEYVATARDALAEHDRALAADPQWRAPDTAIGRLMSELGLGHRSIDVLLVVGAAALRGETARLYGILANDPGRATVDELLVHQVLTARYDRHDLAAELDPRAPLVRLAVVQPRGRRSRPFTELAVDPVVLDQLRAIPPELGASITVRRASCSLAELDVPRELIAAAIDSLARPAAGPLRLVVRGRLGVGRRSLAAALAGQAGRDLAVLDALAMPRDVDAFVDELGRSVRRAQLSGLVPCIVNLGELSFGERASADVAGETLRAHPGPIAVVAPPELAVPFPPGHVAIELPVPPESQREAIWTRAIGEARLEVGDAAALAARYKIGAGVIRRAVAAVVEPAGDATPAIEGFIRQTRDRRLASYARRVDRLASWSSVVLPPDILDSLRELVARVRFGRTVFETWGMGRMMATSRGLTALFQGQPGTGKTLVAGVIARELGLDLYQVDLSKVMSKWIGETERNLSTIFDAAEDGQSILLFDEADSLFAKRTEVRSSNDRYANLEVNYLLQRLDAFEGIAILTTNSGASIDQAFKRRMSFRLSFPFPDEDTREQLWHAHLPPELPIGGALALDALARKYQLSGGYIRNACLRAAFLAAQEETALHQHHLERAVALEFAELGKLSSGGAID